MKILFSALQFPTTSHPFAAFISMMAKEMAMKRHDVTIVAPQSATHIWFRGGKRLPSYEEIKFDGLDNYIKVYRPLSFTFGSGKLLGRMTLLANKFSTNRCLRRLNVQFDVVYAHFWEAAFNVLRFVYKNGLPLTVVSGEDKILLTPNLTTNELSQLKKLVDNVICVSTKNKNESISNGLTCESKCCVIPNGADIREFHRIDKSECRLQLGFPQDIFIVAFVGRFIHRKGARRVEDAVLKLKDNKIKTIFIGSSMADEDASQEPCGEEIIFKGIVSHEDIPKYLNAADVYVLPTLAEGCSNSIVEALACGLPVISSNLDFNYDVLDSDNSIMLNPLDIDEISAAISKIKSDKDLRNRMSESALKKAKTLSFEKRVDKIIAILNSSKK